jgi:diguanylate cyclase
MLGYIVPWVLASVSVGILAGFLWGRGRGRVDDARSQQQRERSAMMRMMVELLGAADQINTNVENHSSEIAKNVKEVDDLHMTGEMDLVKQVLLSHMKNLLVTNRQMQDDILCTRYRLEEQAVQIDSARREARSDELTGVANRKAFNEKLHLLLDEWRRHQTPFVLIIADLDQFKRVNDSHGHLAGDRVLSSIGALLKQLIREEDFVGRYGGDEFAILLPKTELTVGAELAETIRSGTADGVCRIARRGDEPAVSLSVGVAAPCEGDTDELLIQRADHAMYKAKHRGRNQVQCHQPDEDVVPAMQHDAPCEPLELSAAAL